MPKGIAILGSTGSIGTSALDLIERLNAQEDRERFRVVGLAAHRRVDLLGDQIRRFRPRVAAIGDESLLEDLRRRTGEVDTRILGGPEAVKAVGALGEADFVLAGIVGAAGLEPTFAAVESGKAVGLANKEALVMAGDLMIRTARESGAVLLPVDSEHNALHQCLRGERLEEVRRLVLTASGGPFFARPEVEFSRVSPQEALAHPTWVMGRKISIDSATLMNKGLEVIEAHWLFGVDADSISVVVHPQSTIHSMVEFRDGSFICQLGGTDMRHPIQYALTYPDRVASPLEPVNLASLKSMTFHEPDHGRFPCLGLGYEALRTGGTMPAALNGANEIAVESFLGGEIRFDEIPRVIASVMKAHRAEEATSIDIILQADAWARRAAREATATNRRGGTATCPTH